MGYHFVLKTHFDVHFEIVLAQLLECLHAIVLPRLYSIHFSVDIVRNYLKMGKKSKAAFRRYGNFIIAKLDHEKDIL